VVVVAWVPLVVGSAVVVVWGEVVVARADPRAR
jgi:hypothetical protein